MNVILRKPAERSEGRRPKDPGAVVAWLGNVRLRLRSPVERPGKLPTSSDNPPSNRDPSVASCSKAAERSLRMTRRRLTCGIPRLVATQPGKRLLFAWSVIV